MFFATCPKEIEPLLAKELTELGLKKVQIERGGCSFEGPIQDAYRACLWSRLAMRILYPIDRFKASNPAQLYGGIRKIRWLDHFSPETPFLIDLSSTLTPDLAHTQFATQKAKDAVVDQMQAITGSRPTVEKDDPDFRINIRIRDSEVWVSIDLSGAPLHQRGYRKPGVQTDAPLKENLAAAMLRLAEWPTQNGPQKINLGQTLSMIDPFCGSGTLLIEAAWMALGIAPGLLRKKFGFESWKKFDSKSWQEIRTSAAKARDESLRNNPPEKFLWGSDLEQRSIQLARQNAERAGVADYIQFDRKDFKLALPPTSVTEQTQKWVVSNLPFGERLGEEEQLKVLYSDLGDQLKKLFGGWTAFLLVANPELMRAIGLKPKNKYVVFNGPIECRFLKIPLVSGRFDRKEPKAPKVPTDQKDSSETI